MFLQRTKRTPFPSIPVEVSGWESPVLGRAALFCFVCLVFFEPVLIRWTYFLILSLPFGAMSLLLLFFFFSFTLRTLYSANNFPRNTVTPAKYRSPKVSNIYLRKLKNDQMF